MNEMKHNVDDAELVKKIKEMKVDELIAFLSTLKLITATCSVISVSLIVSALFLQSLIYFILASVATSFMASIAVTTDNVIGLVKHTLQRKNKE